MKVKKKKEKEEKKKKKTINIYKPKETYKNN